MLKQSSEEAKQQLVGDQKRQLREHTYTLDTEFLAKQISEQIDQHVVCLGQPFECSVRCLIELIKTARMHHVQDIFSFFYLEQ